MQIVVVAVAVVQHNTLNWRNVSAITHIHLKPTLENWYSTFSLQHPTPALLRFFDASEFQGCSMAKALSLFCYGSDTDCGWNVQWLCHLPVNKKSEKQAKTSRASKGHLCPLKLTCFVSISSPHVMSVGVFRLICPYSFFQCCCLSAWWWSFDFFHFAFY